MVLSFCVCADVKAEKTERMIVVTSVDVSASISNKWTLKGDLGGGKATAEVNLTQASLLSTSCARHTLYVVCPWVQVQPHLLRVHGKSGAVVSLTSL
jgi:hypothetical protein